MGRDTIMMKLLLAATQAAHDEYARQLDAGVWPPDEDRIAAVAQDVMDKGMDLVEKAENAIWN